MTNDPQPDIAIRNEALLLDNNMLRNLLRRAYDELPWIPRLQRLSQEIRYALNIPEPPQ